MWPMVPVQKPDGTLSKLTPPLPPPGTYPMRGILMLASATLAGAKSVQSVRECGAKPLISLHISTHSS